MKKYIYEAPKTQWEKPEIADYIFCAPAEISVLASSEDEAMELARTKIQKQYTGSGQLLLSGLRLVASYDLPVDWSYGYGDERKTGHVPQEIDTVSCYEIR